MKKFTIKGVLDGFRSSVPQPVKPDQEIVENLRPEHFQVKKTFRHGFPHQPTAVAFDPVQRLLAIGTKSGSLRILGRPGVDAHVRHEGCTAVVQLQFLINEGALVSATADDTLHLWNFRQKIPQVVQSLKFQRERITCIHLPLQSKWLYVGTERGNIHVLHIETFVLSGYVINWNKAIEVSRKTHPGAVVHLSDNPLDLSKMLIGYESGQMVFWDLKTKNAEYRCHSDVPLKSISWHHEGKQFMCSHTDGSLATWTVRQVKPTNITHPHAKTTKDGEPEPCKPIQKVEWKLSRSGEAYVIFSGGLAYDTTGRTPSITVIHGKTTTVLEMEHNVIDFITLCENPWTSDYQDPYAVVVLLQNDLVVIDLLTPGFPCFENPYPMDIHESPVTCCAYFADCPSDLVPAFYSVGSKSQKKTGFSDKDWPISGGEWSSSSSGYNEIILTGHADGSIKFWDASAGTLQVLYKLKTAKLFEKGRTRSIDSEEDPLAIQLIFLCPESRKLAIAGSGRHVVLFKFKKVESMSEVVTLEISLTADPAKEIESSSDHDSPAGNTSGSSESKNNESNQPLKVKTGLQKRAAGFQATLVCLTIANIGEQAENITALSLNSSYGLMAYGNESGIVIIDIVQKISLIVLNTADIGGNTDPCQRVLRSPKRQDELKRENEDKARSPSTDQVQISFAVFPDSKVDSDKYDSSFQRSRSSSMSSLENITTETISCLTFADSYTKKSDTSPVPTLWIGTSLGSIQTVIFNTPARGERHAHPVVVSTCNGSTFKLKGCILSMFFLDCNGALIPYSYESWKDDSMESKERNRSQGKCNSRTSSPSMNTQVATGEGFEDRQFVVLASEKQARVVALPSQNCQYRQQLAESHIVIKAEITSLKDNVCLVCYISNGHIATYSLPSLRPLIDVDFLPLIDLSFQTTKHGIVDPMLSIWGHQLFVNGDTDQIAKTLCFSNRGHGLYLSSPTEIQKFSVSSQFCGELTEMMGDLFTGHDMPEPPKESFFKGLFGGGSRSLDREELFGESSGRASRTVAKHIPGPNAATENMRERVTTATGEVNVAHQMVLERGEKLSQLEERTGRMMSEAEGFSQSAHGLMLKYKDKKWYQL
ncbi:syntaxin-binding protein tomosyn isoform X5 [Bombus vancouverensis nearcticus]|uniref:Syntaxin-binding protein 5-like n=1 Tax=Bombus bifarius TaxID=103933 RepID=A0A6P8MMH9_9HYME|nr:syntaxin-binding protein 5 isoform X10 [Bombus vancouverensis nearcticus]XP_033303332.1 syntaxin-binding protein 5 isoform X10 [Bombus bifarius]